MLYSRLSMKWLLAGVLAAYLQ